MKAQRARRKAESEGSQRRHEDRLTSEIDKALTVRMRAIAWIDLQVQSFIGKASLLP